MDFYTENTGFWGSCENHNRITFDLISKIFGEKFDFGYDLNRVFESNICTLPRTEIARYKSHSEQSYEDILSTVEFEGETYIIGSYDFGGYNTIWRKRPEGAIPGEMPELPCDLDVPEEEFVYNKEVPDVNFRKQVNNYKIKYDKKYQKYSVSKVVVYEEFEKVEDAITWCKNN